MKTTLLLGAATLAVAATPADAQRRRDITPYIEVGQVLTADLDGPTSDVLTALAKMPAACTSKGSSMAFVQNAA